MSRETKAKLKEEILRLNILVEKQEQQIKFLERLRNELSQVATDLNRRNREEKDRLGTVIDVLIERSQTLKSLWRAEHENPRT